jgi:alkylation response protein AidB-like acyl-CoA dehydrogenase
VESFGQDARRWLDTVRNDAPPDWGPIMPPEARDAGRAWQGRIHDAGFAAIHWPAKTGGRGLTRGHTAAWTLACAEAGVPSVLNMVGLVLVAEALLAYGTPEQQAAHLPVTARGDIVWCQLFSEPGAGSDLASLSTRAESDGAGGFVVNGQKVWSSGARASDRGILLARTDPSAPRHRGISCFLVDMATPGIECRPLRQMTGGSEFDEVFLTDVELRPDSLLGPLHGGWGVAMATLTNERGHIGASTVGLAKRVDALLAEARAAGPLRPVDRDRLLRDWMEAKVLLALASRQGPVASVASSLLKLAMTELSVAVAQHRVTRVGMAATLLANPACQALLGSPGAKLGGGTSEVQRNILGELVLGLPREPRP